MKKIFPIYCLLIGIETIFMFLLLLITIRFQIPFMHYVTLIIMFLLILIFSFTTRSIKFYIRIILFLPSIPIAGFIFGYTIPRKWYAPKIPVFTTLTASHPTKIEGIRYFDLKDEWNLCSKYGGVYNWNWAPTPEGFEISPNEADFIFTFIYHKGWHSWEPRAYIIFYGTNNYYMAEHSMIYDDYEQLVQNTTQINGQNGQVFNMVSNIWENVGYVHLFHSDVINKIKINSTRSEVIDTFGHVFEMHKPAHSALFRTSIGWTKPPENTESLEYWCRDGNFVILLTDGYVTSIFTNQFMGR